MRNIKFIFLALFGILALSCMKDDVAQNPEMQKTYDVVVGLSNVDLEVSQTRSDVAATDAERKVDDAYVIVYTSSGTLVDYKAWSGTSVKFALEAGTYHFYAVINSGMTSAPASLSELKALKGNLKDDISGFTMLGHTEKVISTGNEKFSITAYRLASKVVFQDLKVNFSATGLQAQPLVLNAVYLINVPGDLSYEAYFSGSAYTPSLWYNQMKYISGDCNTYLYAGSLGISVAHGNTVNVNRTFYAYPNGTASDAHNGTFSARKTRLILETQVDGGICYYPFTFDQLESNKVYTVKSLTVTRKGVSTPDDVWNSGEVSGDLVIGDWTEGGDYSEEL